MNLLYIWNENYGHNWNTGYLLSSKFNISYDVRKNKLEIARNEEYIEDFWGKSILDVIAVVGQNGSGKTELANLIIGALGALEEADEYGIAFFVVLEDERNRRIEIFGPDKYTKFQQMEIDCRNSPYEVKTGRHFKEFEKYKVAYFTNALSKDDYIYRKGGYVYDSSVGGRMHRFQKENNERQYIAENKSVVLNYFDTEIEKMIRFLFSDVNKMDIPFKVPEYLTIELNDYGVNQKYIEKRFERIHSDTPKWKEWSLQPGETFSKVFDEFAKIYGKTWIDRLLINLVLNLYKEACIPNTSGENTEQEIICFFRVMEKYWRSSAKQNEVTSIELTIRFLNDMFKALNGRYVQKYLDFVKWIEKNRVMIEKNSSWASGRCTLKLEDHEDFVRELMVHYRNTNFSYPYFSFSFGLSTGEFNFLNLFANVHEALSTGNVTVHGTEKCTNALLIFDEADLSLHPRWQQQYVDWVTRFASSCARGCNLQILITTHSPIMLSDFPKSNVLYLCDNEVLSHMDQGRVACTFGSNIHSLFLNSFFLEDTGTMGAFAEKKINGILKQLRSKEKMADENGRVLKIINSIGDDLIRNQMLKLYKKNQNLETVIQEPQKTMKNADIDRTVSALRMQVDELLSVIEQLENLRND